MSMTRVAVLLLPAVVSCLAGCNPDRVHTVDLSKMEEFAWDGRIEVQTRYRGFFDGYDVEQIVIRGKDGRTIMLDTTDGRRMPKVTGAGDPKRSHNDIVSSQTKADWRFTTHNSEPLWYRPAETNQSKSTPTLQRHNP